MGSPRLDETSIAQAITTLEALLKLPEEVNLANPSVESRNGKFSQQLKRLQSIARQVTCKEVESRHQRRKMLQQLKSKKDEKIGASKGIRRLRQAKEVRLEHVFKKFERSSLKLENSLVNESLEMESKPNEGKSLEIDPSSDCLGTIDTTTTTPNIQYGLTFKCYICKTSHFQSHHFYDQICVKCGDLNYKKRFQSADLSGKIALVTGGRIKIGYETTLKLLRTGAHVIVTTRFPVDAVVRYSNEHDFQSWNNRLEIYGVDFRFISMVETFCKHVNERYPKLDILIQNAAQTIRRPVQFYRHLMEGEMRYGTLSRTLQGLVKEFDCPYPSQRLRDSSTSLTVAPTKTELIPDETSAAMPHPNCKDILTRSPSSSTLTSSSAYSTLSSTAAAACSQLLVHPEDFQYGGTVPNAASQSVFPSGIYDENHQQSDLRNTNSWILHFDQVETVELVEVQLINCIAPYIILSKLTPLLAAAASQTPNALLLSSSSSPPLPAEQTPHGWIIMVSSMEGKFNREKTTAHPHTNCAKAGLNMLVRTAAPYYKAQYNLLMNAVDTGWITDEDPIPLKDARTKRFRPHPPLDEIDGAARILDPIFQTINEREMIYGCFLKDYRVSTW